MQRYRLIIDSDESSIIGIIGSGKFVVRANDYKRYYYRPVFMVANSPSIRENNSGCLG
jgi:hypothetical protein